MKTSPPFSPRALKPKPKALSWRRIGLIGGPFLGILGVSVGVWSFFKGDGSSQEIPVIMPDPRPFKMRPEDPETMKIPHRDKTIYQKLTPEEGQKTSERIVEEAEIPIPLQPVLEENIIPNQSSPLLDEEDLPLDASTLEEDVVEVLGAMENREDVVSSENLPPLKESAIELEEEADISLPLSVQIQGGKLKSKSSDQSYEVRLGLLKSFSDAKEEWRHLKEKFGDVLPSHPRISKIDSGLKNRVRYYLHIGPYALDEATELCNALKKKQTSCTLVKN